MLVMCLVGFLTGCAPPVHQYIVYRDVPELPSFVVRPPNNYMHEILFANEIEEAIIGCGVKVVQRPGTKQVTTEASIGGMQGERIHDPGTAVTSVREADAKRVESYYEYENIDADYVAETCVDKRQVRILKKETLEVLTVFYANDYLIKPGKRLSWRYKVYETLRRMGIQVRNPIPAAPRSDREELKTLKRGRKTP